VAAPALEPLPLADIVAAPIAPKPAPAPVTKPVAKEAALPLAAAPSLPVVVRPKPVTTDGIDLRELLEVDETVDEIKPKAVESKGVDLAQASRTQTYFPGQYEFETKPATGRWMVRAIAAGVLLVAPLWYFALRPKPSDTANSATVETPAITTPAQAEVSPNVVPASSPMTVTPNAAPTPAPSKPASTPAVSKTRSNEPADNVVDTVKPAEPAPLVLASGRPMSGRNIEDASAPSVPLAIPAGSVPLPAVGASASAATPSLAPRVTHSWTGGTPIRKVAPIYPSTARDRGLRGEVEVVFTVRKDGSVANVHAISGNPILATAAVEAVKSWRYEPFKADGQPAEVQNSVKLNFVLPR
jgi:protein TonB